MTGPQADPRLKLWQHLESKHGVLFTTQDARSLTISDLARLHERHHEAAAHGQTGTVVLRRGGK